jgi:hypothetical protein
MPKRYLSRAGAARELNLTPAYVYELPESVLPVAAVVDQGVRLEKVYSPEAVEVLRAARAAKAMAKKAA